MMPPLTQLSFLLPLNQLSLRGRCRLLERVWPNFVGWWLDIV